MDLSIIIININGFKYLSDCLDSIANSGIKEKINYEILIFDNGSNELEKKKYSEIYKIDNNIKVFYSDYNIGPAKGRNLAANKANSPIIAFLDNDTKVDKNFFVEPLKIFRIENNVGIIQCKLLRINTKKFDYAGDYITNFGLLKRLAETNLNDENQFKTGTKILSAKSAGMFMRKTTFDAIKGFDEDFFIYCEETDLGWKSWLLGYQNIFCNESIVYHHWSTSKKILGNKQVFLNYYYGPKNYLSTYFKNLEYKNFKLFFWVLFFWLSLSLFYLVTLRIKKFFFINFGIISFFVTIKKTIKKRYEIQAKRKLTDKKLFLIIKKNTSFIELIRKAFQI